MQFSDGDVRGGTGQHKMLVIAALVCGLSFFGGGLAVIDFFPIVDLAFFTS